MYFYFLYTVEHIHLDVRHLVHYGRGHLGLLA